MLALKKGQGDAAAAPTIEKNRLRVVLKDPV